MRCGLIMEQRSSGVMDAKTYEMALGLILEKTLNSDLSVPRSSIFPSDEDGEHSR